jgi:hypothetical protein
MQLRTVISITLLYSGVSQTRPDLEFFLAPTTPSTRPAWLTSTQTTIAVLVKQQVQDQRTRVLPLPGYFVGPASLDPDGVHFLPVDGIHYVMQLIDSAR